MKRGKVIFEKTARVAPLTSIVVPFFNTEDYISETLEALTLAGEWAFEVITVNDGSTDGSETIVADYFKRRGVAGKIIRQKNAGLGAARNTGFVHSRGTYIGFFDSDDIFDGYVVKQTSERAEKTKCDIAIMNARWFNNLDGAVFPFYDGRTVDEILRGSSYRVTSAARDPLLFALEPKERKLWRKQFFSESNLLFPEGVLFEDYALHYKALTLAKRIGITSDIGLYYRLGRPNQLVLDRTTKRWDALKACEECRKVASNAPIDPLQGGLIVQSLTRFIFWSGRMVPLGDRLRFFEEACAIFGKFPAEWQQALFAHRQIKLGDMIKIKALSFGYPRVLCDWSVDGRKISAYLPMAKLLFSNAGREFRSKAMLKNGLTELFTLVSNK